MSDKSHEQCSAASEGTFASVVVKRMTDLIETADKTKTWEMEAVAEMMKAVHLITCEPQEVAVNEALRAIYEWYDRDGSVGEADRVFEEHRPALALMRLK